MIEDGAIAKLKAAGVLNDRWFDFPDSVYNHPDISRYLKDTSRFILVAAGRRAYKTEIAKRKIILEAMLHENRRYIVGAATYTQGKLIFWNSLNELIPKILVRKIRDSELSIELTNGSIIQLFSVDSVNRIEGTMCHGCVLDECSEYSVKEVWSRHIRPMLSDTGGWAILLGVPRQSVDISWKEMYTQYKKYPEWSIYNWSSVGILPQSEIDEIKATTDPITFDIEYGGIFASLSGGLAYYRYNPDIHIKSIPFDINLPVRITFDFNHSIMTPLICQIYNNDFTAIHDHIVDRHTNVYKIAPLIQKKLIELHNGDANYAKSKRTFLYGDASGFSESANSRGSAWSELKDMFKGWNIDLRVHGKNPLIDRRVSSVNARLQSADDRVHCFVNPKCEELIKDFELVSMDDLRKDKDKVGERTHASDAAGYLLEYEYPIDGGGRMWNA